MIGNGAPGLRQCGAAHKRGLVDTEQRRGLLNLGLDAGFGALFHPGRSRLVNGGRTVLEAQNGPILRLFSMYGNLPDTSLQPIKYEIGNDVKQTADSHIIDGTMS